MDAELPPGGGWGGITSFPALRNAETFDNCHSTTQIDPDNDQGHGQGAFASSLSIGAGSAQWAGLVGFIHHGQIEQQAEICPISGIAQFTRRSGPAARMGGSGVLFGPLRARLGVFGVLFGLFRARLGLKNRCVVTNRLYISL